MPDESPISRQSAHDALQGLKEQLETAYAEAESQDVRNLLDARLDAIDPLLTELNREDIAAHTIALQAAADSTAAALKQLGALKAKIQTISDDVGKATQALGDVDKLLTAVKSYFAI
jgi:chromosome segregation ATPase